MRRSVSRAKADDAITERPEDISADLPYELQSKMLDQLATVSVAGTGLAITLIGSVLQTASRDVWVSVALFGLAAVTAVGGNVRLIEGIALRRPVLQRSRFDISMTMTLIGAAIGYLSLVVYSGNIDAPAARPAADAVEDARRLPSAAR